MTMKMRAIKKREPLAVEAGVSRLARVEFARHPYPALLKEPAHFWDEVFIANEAYVLGEVTHPRIRRKLAYDAATHRLFLEYIEGATLHELVQAGVTRANPGRTHRLLQSVAETVADMHAGIFCGRPIVHNDLKSKNVLVPVAAPEETQLIDFSHSYFEGNLPPFITDKKQIPRRARPNIRPRRNGREISRKVSRAMFSPLASWLIMRARENIRSTAARRKSSRRSGR